MLGNYSGYAISVKDDAYQECLRWFWSDLGCDETLPKWFLEDLIQMMERIEAGEEKLIAFDWDLMDRMKEETELLEGLWHGDV